MKRFLLFFLLVVCCGIFAEILVAQSSSPTYNATTSLTPVSFPWPTTTTLPNSSTATVLNEPVCIVGGQGELCPTNALESVYAGVCTAGCGSTGTATIAQLGEIAVTFDNSASVNHYVTLSSTPGEFHDNGGGPGGGTNGWPPYSVMAGVVADSTHIWGYPPQGLMPSVFAPGGALHMGAANTTVSEPGYLNSSITQVTDANSWNGTTEGNRQRWQTCCSSWADTYGWNSNSTMFFVQDGGGGVALVTVDSSSPPHFTVQFGSNAAGTTLNDTNMHEAVWDRNNPDVFYTRKYASADCGTDTQIVKWTLQFSSGAPVYPVCGDGHQAPVVDLSTLANCVNTTTYLLSDFFPDNSSQNFAFTAALRSGSGFSDVGVVNLTNGCRWFNIGTQAIGGNWGPTGTAVQGDTSTILNTGSDGTFATFAVDNTYDMSAGDQVNISGTTNCGGALNGSDLRVASATTNTFQIQSSAVCSSAADSGSAVRVYGLHDIRMFGDGTMIILGPSGSEQNRHFWDVTGLNVYTSTSGQYGTGVNNGHWYAGYNHFIFNGSHSGDSNWCKYAKMSALPTNFSATWLALIPNTAACGTGTNISNGDDHPSLMYDPTNTDSYPVFDSSVFYYNPTTLAWQSELTAQSVANPGTVWRFGANLITGMGFNFNTAYGIGQVSPDGKWMMFASDWMGTLGTSSDGLPLYEVFVAKLPLVSSASVSPSRKAGLFWPAR